MMPQNKLKELITLLACIPTKEINDFLDIYKELYYNGHRGDALWGSLCDNGYTELRTVSTADKDELLVLLEKNYKKAYTGLQDIGHYLITTRKGDENVVVGIRHKLFADDLTKLYFFKTLDDTEEVLYYEDGYYHYGGESIIRSKSEEMFGENVNTYRRNEIINHVRTSTYIKREDLNKDIWILNLENGLFNIKSFEFTNHIPDLITTIRLPIKYNPAAACPNIEKFISEIVYPDDIPLIGEMIGYTLYHDYTYQNWFLLHGEGSNGKSKLLGLIGNFLGRENVSSIGLQELDQRFAAVNLFGKSANIVADLGSGDLKRTSTLKKLTGGDLINAEPKFKDAFGYYNFAKLIYSCNTVPLTEDKSRAFFRRVIFISFPNSFIGENDDVNILDKLMSEEEMSGLFNVGVEGLKRVINNRGFSRSMSPEDVEDLYERASNPVYGFFHDWCEIDLDSWTTKTDFYDQYCQYCKEKKVVAFSQKKFIDEMKRLTTLVDAQKGAAGSSKKAWLGIVVFHNDHNEVKSLLSAT